MKLRFIIKKPLITEKTMAEAAMHNCYTFLVAQEATKAQIKEAIITYFGVEVVGVTTTKNAGFSRKTGRKRLPSRVMPVKKAVVKLKPGASIKAFEVKG